jgi:AraC-like DNA-binding protein
VLTLIRTDDYPAADRFTCYREAVGRLAAPVEIRCDDLTGFRARMTGARIGDLTVTSLFSRTTGRYEVHRDPALIRRSDPGAYRLIYSLGGRSRLYHANREVVLEVGTLTLFDMSSPFTGGRERHAPADEWVMVTLPRALLPLPHQEISPLLGAALSGRSGIGALVSAFVTELARSAGHYRSADAARLSAVFIDLLVSLLAHELETPGTAADDPDTRCRILRLQIQAYVQRHLADPDLSPASIAAAHHISVRSLHRLFQDHEETVAAWIRERRLERCRRDLADPRLSDRPAHAIGRKWGFADPAHFSRAFRATHGLSPSAYRSDCQESS